MSERDVRLNLLIAYPYYDERFAKALQGHDEDVRLLLDSGAYTAWRSGKPIDVDDYCRFIENLPVQPWRYFALDVVGDPAGTMRNFEVMVKRGFKPVPIFTRGEDISVVEDYYKHSDVVGIGGLVRTPRKKQFVNGVMKQIGKRRVHWLGFTDTEYLRHYRPYMCDTNSWDYGSQYGKTYLYMGMGGAPFYQLWRLEMDKQPPDAVMERIRDLGFDPYLFRKSATWHGGWSINRKLCVASYLEFSLDVQRYLGTLMFNAVAAGDSAEQFIKAFIRRRTSHDNKSDGSAVRRAGLNDVPVLGEAGV
jgi:hypothetical protein